MTVYIDSLFLTNLFMDSVILFITCMLRRRQVTFLRLFAAAFVSAFYGALMFFPSLSFMYSAVFKILFSIIPVLIVFGKRGLRDFIASFVIFWTITVACGGVIFLVSTTTDFGSVMQTMSSNCIMYVKLNPFILGLGCVIIYVFAESVRRICIRNFSRDKLFLNLEASYMNETYSFTGLIDTGCELTEPLSGAPIIVAEKRNFAGIPESPSRISVKTASGNTSLEMIFPTRIVCTNQKVTIADGTAIAMTDTVLSEYGLYSAVINPFAVEDMKNLENIQDVTECITC